MEYKFKIATVPEKKSGCHLPAYTEGPLEVWLDGQQFVRVDEALLVEFAVVLSKWLRTQPSSLYYASMDFEEEPIFALSLQGDAFELLFRLGERCACRCFNTRCNSSGPTLHRQAKCRIEGVWW